ncbi:uncharacterized protein CHSO_4636 [Chryseobacterium sp. StRB126]|nr:uncharacterized protein CHSO_4636 [Chryseobacterium sp. StRB126]
MKPSQFLRRFFYRIKILNIRSGFMWITLIWTVGLGALEREIVDMRENRRLKNIPLENLDRGNERA